MPSLKEILAPYSFSENSRGSDKDTTHSYADVYEILFKPYRAHANCVVELGVYSGAFTVVLSQYFATAAVHGFDITLGNLKYSGDRVKFHEVSATNSSAPSLVGDAIDIVIEDGSHTIEDQVRSFEVWSDAIKPNGMYIVEDVDGATFDALKQRLEPICVAKGFSYNWYDLRDVKNRYDDIIGVFVKVPATHAS